MTLNDLKALAADTPSILSLFEAEPDRLDRMALTLGPLRVDFSKQRVSSADLSALIGLAEEKKLLEWRERLFAGEPINTSEDRAVLHTALRGVGGSKDCASAKPSCW